jgi:hypothetical protein
MQDLFLEGADVLPKLAVLLFDELHLLVGLAGEVIVDELVFD